MSALTLREIARALGGEVQGRQVLAPGPGHSPGDRSLSVRLSHQSPTGYIVFSHSGDDFRVARDFVAAKIGIGSDAWRKCRQIGDITSWIRKFGEGQDASANSDKANSETNRDNISVCSDEQPKSQRDTSKKEASDNAARIARARAIWDGAGPASGSLVEAYIAGRGLSLDLVSNRNEVIRFHPRCPWRDETEGRTIYVPAMVALMRSVTTNEPQAIHRTRLTPDGAKVDRRMLGIAAGAAVKLDADDEVTMGLAIGEGIETVLAARQIGLRPAWALASAGAIAAFPVLGGIEALSILGESDETNARAVNTCGMRWHEAGREVTIFEPITGSDVNDALRSAVNG